jgi:electron-transferring-flavoprotein dehydrogenase
MKSGILAAEATVDAIINPAKIQNRRLTAYNEKIKGSWIWTDLYAVRNIKPLITKFGTRLGMLFGGIETLFFSLNKLKLSSLTLVFNGAPFSLQLGILSL